jgi:hypothetical protein
MRRSGAGKVFYEWGVQPVAGLPVGTLPQATPRPKTNPRSDRSSGTDCPMAQLMDTREFCCTCALQNESSKLKGKKLVTTPPAAPEDPIQKAS